MPHRELDVYLMKVQSVKGTGETTMINTDYAYVRGDAKFEPKYEFSSADYATGTFGQEAEVRGRACVEQTFAMPIIPTASTAEPAIGPWLTCCGMAKTGPTGNIFSYAPSSVPSAWKDCTVWKYSGDVVAGASLLTKAHNCAYNLKLTGKVGEPLWAEFTGKGKLPATPAAATYVSGTLTIPSVAPAVIKATTCTVMGLTLKADNVSLDLGNEVVMVGNLTADYGYDSATIGKRSSKWSARVYQDTHATFNPFTDMAAGTLSTFQLTFGAAGGKTTILATSTTQCTQVTDADDNGILVYDLAGDIINNDWSISLNNT